MFSRTSFHKKNRGGGGGGRGGGLVKKHTVEHYLRDDISCGAPDAPLAYRGGEESTPCVLGTASQAQRYAILAPDAARALLDVAEQAAGALEDVILLASVLDHLKTHGASRMADRWRALASQQNPKRRVFVFSNEHHKDTYAGPQAKGESPEARDARAVAKAAAWYANAMAGTGIAIHVVTDEATIRDAVQAATADSGQSTDTLICETPVQLVERDAPTHVDSVLRSTPAAGAGGEQKAKQAAGGLFAEHLNAAQVRAGLQSGALYQGTLRCSRFSSNSGYVGARGASDTDGFDIAIKGRANISRATDGDLVAVQIITAAEAEAAANNDGDDGDDGDVGLAPDVAADAGKDSSTSTKRQGRVVAILRRAWRERGYAGCLDTDSMAKGAATSTSSFETRVLFVPHDRRMPKVRLWTRQAANLMDQRLVVALDEWPADSPHPQGHLVKVLGKIGDKVSETAVVLLEHDVNSLPFTESVHACLPPLPWKFHEERDMWVGGGLRAGFEDGGGDDEDALMLPASKDGNDANAAGATPISDVATATDNFLDSMTTPMDTTTTSAMPSSASAARPTQRLDLRHVHICSVDPPGCRDIDDALHCSISADGRKVSVGVHIADVGHFVQANTALDAEASRRGTTVYLVDRRLDMLPKPLTEDICSLNGGVERLAFSVLWEFDVDECFESQGSSESSASAKRRRTTGENAVPTTKTGFRFPTCEATFVKTVIRSRRAMTYAEAQASIDDANDASETALGLRRLLALARCMRQSRFDAGALSLASSEVKFSLDAETHDPTDVGVYQLRETNAMVEEFMLAANVAVATKLSELFPEAAILRRHPNPTAEMLRPMVQLGKALGLPLSDDVSTSSKALAKGLDSATRDDDPTFNKVVRMLATRCMQQAVYFTSGDVPVEMARRHYGLAMACYTHFTSPIRRYADLMVHRMLAYGLGYYDAELGVSSEAQAVVKNLNYRHRNAQLAGRSSVELHTLLYFASKFGDVPQLEPGRITKVSERSINVLVPMYGLEGPVNVEGGASAGGVREDDGSASLWSSFDGNVMAGVLASQPGRRVQVLDQVMIRISIEHGGFGRRRLVLELPKLSSSSSIGVASSPAPYAEGTFADKLAALNDDEDGAVA
ncbi:hypothetical protein PPROV_001090400 [Pycnococcus provasolii]|uniref:Ribosomal RNA-processing protein 44 n=1 Tax=Pycnococcus provasolii TaxID=41880 RepID=A0A830HXG9_9CHLO|nr:hypothetical protein PPROV_001090400 [Pycnococcus provasolii]